MLAVVTKYAPWRASNRYWRNCGIAMVAAGWDGLRNSWQTAAVRRQGGLTRISAMIAVSDVGAAKLAAELSELARRHKLELDETLDVGG